jgi:hypothetical protein
MGPLDGAFLPTWPGASVVAGLVEIHMTSDPNGSTVHFDPVVGIRVAPGQRLRWRCVVNVRTTIAYHPKGHGHSPRISSSPARRCRNPRVVISGFRAR